MTIEVHTAAYDHNGQVTAHISVDGVAYDYTLPTVSDGSPVWVAVDAALNEGLSIKPFKPPEVNTQPAPIVIPAVTFWERTTEAEGEEIEAMLAQQPFRVRQIFTTAQTYRSDQELWPLLQQVAVQLFGEERAAELLAPYSEGV